MQYGANDKSNFISTIGKNLEEGVQPPPPPTSPARHGLNELLRQNVVISANLKLTITINITNPHNEYASKVILN